RRQGVRVRSGDAVLLRTGYGRVRHEAGAASGFTQAGWHASCLPWLHERQVALIGADTPQEVQPSGYEDVLMPVHAVSLVANRHQHVFVSRRLNLLGGVSADQRDLPFM